MRLPYSCVLTHNLSIIHPDNISTFIVTFAVDKCHLNCREGSVVAAALPQSTVWRVNRSAAARIQSFNIYIFKHTLNINDTQNNTVMQCTLLGKLKKIKFLWIPKTLTLRLQPISATLCSLNYINLFRHNFQRILKAAKYCISNWQLSRGNVVENDKIIRYRVRT